MMKCFSCFILFVSLAAIVSCNLHTSKSNRNLVITGRDSARPLPSNPFAPADTSINYLYTESTDTHDYSQNWDFDGDGLLDELLLVGNGGAHVYYDLIIRLKSQKKIFSLQCLGMDYPMLESVNIFVQLDSIDLSYFPKFVVYDFDGDGLQDIYLNIRDTSLDVCADWRKKMGLSTFQIIIQFKSKEMTMADFDLKAFLNKKVD